MATKQPQNPSWKFFTNHGQVLLRIAQDGDITLKDLGQAVGITERAVGRIVADLVEAGIVARRRVGRRNHYLINRNAAIRHAAQAEHQVGPLVDLLRPEGRT